MKDTADVPHGDAARRVNIYAYIHKALRAHMCQTLCAVAQADGDDPADLAAVLGQVRQLMEFCRSHLQHENDFVHTAMETRRPGSAAEATEEHAHHVSALEQLAQMIGEVERASSGERVAALERLHHGLAQFVAENLTHMNIEESDHNAVLWATHSDAELIAIEQAIVASIPPAEMGMILEWMLPALTPAERAGQLGAMRAAMPADAFEEVLGIARSKLAARDWRKLTRALGLAETGALAA